jgi:hypothetical protein
MALLMVQGHLCDTLLASEVRAHPLYAFQQMFHGSTAPGFLFASGFVAGLPRAPLSLKASVRRARRLLFVLGVGYALHLPYLSFFKTLEASAAERAALLACDALQAIAVTQLFVLALQWVAGPRWTAAAGTLALAVIAATPGVWASAISGRLPTAVGAYLDPATGSSFPLFPHAAFVLAGTVAGAALGRQDPGTRHRRALLAGTGLVLAGAALAPPLAGTVEFWGPSPAYALIRIGGLLLLLRATELASRAGLPGIRPLALLGHETLLVYVLHLLLLHGSVLAAAPLRDWAGRLDVLEGAQALLLMLPVLYAAAWAWHRVKAAAPHGATLMLAFLATMFLYEFFTRPW